MREKLSARRQEQQQEYVPKPLDLSEYKTRKLYIDAMLCDAGWTEGKDWINEVELPGMPNKSEIGYADYVLYDDSHKPLAVIEAKRTCVDVSKGRQQAKLYADLLEQKYNRRPVIFLTNGFETHIIDGQYPERKCSVIYSKRDLEKWFNLLTMRTSLRHVCVDKKIAGRYYQEAAIKAVCSSFDEKNRRKGLENYWNELVGKNGGYRVDLRQITSSNKFWYTLKEKIKQGCMLTGLHLDLDKVLADTGIDEQTREKAVLFTSFLEMLNDIGAGNGGFFFHALPGTGLNLERAEYNLGMVVALACQRGFVVKAQVDNNPDWITSEASAPFTMRLDSSAFIKPEGTEEQVRDENKKQLHVLKSWFDCIITNLNQINKDKQNEQTRHTVKR